METEVTNYGWNKFQREDLRSIPLMQSNGWTVETYNGQPVTPEDPPHDPVRFRDGIIVVWKIREGWTQARLVDNKYTDHKIFDSLKDVLAQKSPIYRVLEQIRRQANINARLIKETPEYEMLCKDAIEELDIMREFIELNFPEDFREYEADHFDLHE